MPIKKIIKYARAQNDETRNIIVWVITGICVAGIILIWIALLISGKFNLVDSVYKKNANQNVVDIVQEGITTLTETPRSNIDALGSDLEEFRSLKNGANEETDTLYNTEI